ncbi:sodium-dependent proline transporter-like isoform X2 [Gordionus sp. m RMFG-2023]|uniref:sodium-dependent proline transporter-like isoform X2 n=1 Tax=Gordionus sp. m RMFG-2023 TaxID=3053472 RepID=UPI0031FBEFC7
MLIQDLNASYTLPWTAFTVNANSRRSAFLIPYCLVLFAAGLPLFLMELALGQYSSLGPFKLFQKFSPAFSGIGMAMIIVSLLVSIYYNMILAWTLFYLANSFTAVLPWSHCDNWWNTANCFDAFKARECSSKHMIYLKGHCFNVSHNQSDVDLYEFGRKDSPAEEYFNNRMLKISDGLENMGQVQWELVLCLFFAWCGVFFCLMQGIKTTGKVVYFTALFPYVILIVLLVRAVTLKGASNGLIFYMRPDWVKLVQFKVWKEAFLQIFYSLGPAFGCLMTISSYNSFHHDIYRDGMIVGLLNSGTSIFAGSVVFSIIGFMAHDQDTSVDKVIHSGLGLAFVAYPTAISRLAWSPFWSVIFFLMLISIGLDSQGFPIQKRKSVNQKRKSINQKTNRFYQSKEGKVSETLEKVIFKNEKCQSKKEKILQKGENLIKKKENYQRLSKKSDLKIFNQIRKKSDQKKVEVQSKKEKTKDLGKGPIKFAMVETILTMLYDQWPGALRPRKILVSAITCFLFFLSGIPLTMNGGIYLFSLMDNYSAGWPLLFIGLIECVIVAYIYGIEKFLKDIEIMIGYRVNIWWKLCWKYIAPASTLLFLLYDWVSSSGLSYGDFYIFPPWAISLGWCMAIFPVSFIPGLLIYNCITFIYKNIGRDTGEANIDVKDKKIRKSDFKRLFLAKEDWNENKGLVANMQYNTNFYLK